MNREICISDLAVFGGVPAFDQKLHVGRPNSGDRKRLIARLEDLLDNNRFTNDGPYVKELEREISKMIGAKHCMLTCNGTTALQLLARACDLSGEVIVPSFTFIATAHALQWMGITPVFCDIDPNTHNIDPKKVEEKITDRTSAIMGVHLWGRPCNIEELSRLADEHSLKLLFDAAHAFGASYQGEMIGNFGLGEAFSFHATKFVNSFEGGAVVTNSDEVALNVILMRNFGFAGYDNVISAGTNGKMNEVSAAMGLTSFESMDAMVSINKERYIQYHDRLQNLCGLSIIEFDEKERCNYQFVVVELDHAITGVTAAQLSQILWAENILARRYYHPGCHRSEPYRSNPLYSDFQLPHTEEVSDRVLCLPAGSGVSEEDVDTICQIIRLLIENGSQVGKLITASGV